VFVHKVLNPIQIDPLLLTEYSDKMKLTEDSDQRKEAEVGPASHVSVVTETSPSETGLLCLTS
jgi:hypothetical protein